VNASVIARRAPTLLAHTMWRRIHALTHAWTNSAALSGGESRHTSN
jgi:hypothetical protein